MPGQSPSLPPRQPRRTPPTQSTKSPPRQRPAKKHARPPIAAIAGGVVALSLLAIAVVFGSKLLRDGQVPSIPGVSSLPALGGDTPSSVIGELVDIINDVQSTLTSITDTASRDAAGKSFETMTQRLHKLQRRIALIDPVSKKELAAAAAKYEGRLNLDGIDSTGARLESADLLNEEFAWIVTNISQEVVSTVSAIKTHLEVLPEPRDEPETLARDYAQLHRNQSRILAKIESASDVPAAVTELKSLEAEFAKLQQRKESIGQGMRSIVQMASTKYLKYSGNASELAGTIERGIHQDFGDQPTLRDATVAVSTASSKFDFAVAGVSGNTASPTGMPYAPPGGNPHTTPPPGFGPPGRPLGFPPGAPSPSSDDPSRITVVIQGGPFVKNDSLRSEEGQNASNQRFEALNAANDSLGKLGGTNRHGIIQDGNARIAITFDQGFQHLVDTIDQANLGQVTHVNHDTRTITIQAPPVKP